MFKKNNPTIALNVLYTKELKICPAYISKIVFQTFVKEKSIIANEEKEVWHCLAVKKSSALLKRVTSKQKVDFYNLNCFHSFRTENKL